MATIRRSLPVLLAAALAAGVPACAYRAVAAPAAPFRLASLDSLRRFDANRLDLWTTNSGWLGVNLDGFHGGLEFPRGSGKSVIFAAGLWIGARVDGATRVTVAEYATEWRPGRILGATPEPPDGAHVRTWKVRPAGAWRAPADSARVEAAGGGDPLAHESWLEYARAQPSTDAPLRPVRLPDPASPGDSAWVMGPDLPGELALWSVFNDADAAAHANQAGGTAPLGLEVRQVVSGAATTPGNVAFVRWKVFHHGAAPLDSAYATFWVDPDLGGANDDLVGWDAALQMGYCYNAGDDDAVYGARPPAVGVRYLGGSTGALAGAFSKYIGGTDPSSPEQSFALMRGLQFDGGPWIDPGTAQPTRFPFAGDPVAGTGWLDTNPTDRRFLVSAGPFDLAPGDSASFDFAIVVGSGSTRVASVDRLRCQARLAGDAAAAEFAPLYPSHLALTEAVATPDEVRLGWTADGVNPRPLEVRAHAGGAVEPWPDADDDLGSVAPGPGGNLSLVAPPLAVGETRTYGLFEPCDPLRPLSQATLSRPVEPLAFRVTSPVTTGPLDLRLTIEREGPARLEAFTITGRRVLARDLGVLEPGPHALAVGGTEAWANGLYVFRLTQGGETRSARAVFVR